MSAERRLLGAAAWSVAARAVQFAVGLAAVAVVARWVGPAAWGTFALSWVIVGLVEIVVSSAPADALVQRRALRPGHLDATFWAALGAALLAWGALAAAAGPVAALLGGGAALAAILPLRAATLPLAAAAAVPSALLAREERFKALAGAEAAASLASSAVGIGAALAGAGIWSLVAMELARQALHTAIVWRMARWRPGLAGRRADLADLAGFNLRTWGAWGTLYVEAQLPRLLIGHLLGAQALGFYALAQRLYDQASAVLLDPAYQVVMAGVARRQGEREAVARLAASALRATALAACPVFLGLAAVAPILVPWVFGEEWAPAVPVVQLLMLLGLRTSAATVQVAVIRATGRADLHLRATVIGLAITAALCAAAAPFGLLAIAGAVVAKAFLVWPLYAAHVRATTGLALGRQAAVAAGPLAAGIAMWAGTAAAVASLAGTAPAAGLALAVGSGALLYAAGLAVFAPDALHLCTAAARSLLRRDRRALDALIGGA